MLRDNTYYWRVRTGRSATPASGTSARRSRRRSTRCRRSPPRASRTSACATTCPTRKRSRRGTPGYQTSVPVLTWSAVPGASSYEVDVFPFEGGICDWSDTGGFDNWRIKTASTAWTMLGSGWGGVKPYPDARQVSSDGIRAPVAGKSYCARVRARADRMRLQEVYGEYTYLTDETGTSFTWVGPPTAERARRRVSPGTSARRLSPPGNGRLDDAHAALHVEPAGGEGKLLRDRRQGPVVQQHRRLCVHAAAGLRTADERRSDDVHG